MGLDMYAFVTDKRNLVNDVTLQKGASEQLTLLWQWRKHHNLHGWFEKLYREKGGTKEFNTEIVNVTQYDLDRLQATINEHLLPHTVGFFFGNNPPCAESDQDDLEFINHARKILQDENKAVIYTSWW